MIGCDQLPCAVIRLTALDKLISITGSFWKLIRPVHPVDSGKDVMFVLRPDFQYASYPVIFRLPTRFDASSFGCGFLPFYGRVIGHSDVTIGEILRAVD
jgi:hypothetical protein